MEGGDPWSERLRREGKGGLALALEHFRSRLKQMVVLRMDPRLAGRVDPSDVLQDTYLDAARQLERYLADPQVSVFVWLRRLAWERLLNVRRQHMGTGKRDLGRELHLPEGSSISLGNLLVARGPGPSHEALRLELRELVQSALALLPEGDREVILLRHFEELSNKETAEVLGIQESAATMRYGRALLRLKAALEAQPGFGSSNAEVHAW